MQVTRTTIAATAALTMFCLGAVPMAAQTQNEETVFTYVADYRFKPGKSTEFWASFEKTSQPILDQLVADGTLTEYGRSATVVHSVDGMAEYLWFCAKTVGATQKALEKLMASRAPGVLDLIDKHSDRMFESIIFKVGTKRSSTAYIETSSFVVKPGRGREWLDTFKRYQQPVYDKLVASGVILGYGIDREYIHTTSPGLRNLWVLLPDADAIDKEGAAFDAESNARTPEINRTLQVSMADMTVGDLHRDGLERVFRYVRK